MRIQARWRHSLLSLPATVSPCRRQRSERVRLRDNRRSLALSERNARELDENVAAAVLTIAADGRVRSAD